MNPLLMEYANYEVIQLSYLVNPPLALCSPEPTLKVGLY